MKVLVVYYSRTGRTRVVAEAIARISRADMEVIDDTEQRGGIFGFLKSAYEALFKKLPKIGPIKNEAEKYELVIIGSPTWAGRVSSPVRTYLTLYGAKIKKVAFFTTFSQSGDKIFNQMEELSIPPIATLEIKEKEIKSDTYLEKVEEFIKIIKARLD